MTDIATLFSRDPRGHTDEDINDIIVEMRQRFAFAKSKPDARGLPATRKAKKPAGPAVELDLEDL